jgi:phage terminase large subunit-like protein
VKGWDVSGRPLTLKPWQEQAVRSLLGWDEQTQGADLEPMGRGAGKTVVLITVGRYARARARGRPLRDDPRVAR